MRAAAVVIGMAQAFRQAEVRRFFDIRGNAELISIGVEMALGLLHDTFSAARRAQLSLGVAGGPR